MKEEVEEKQIKLPSLHQIDDTVVVQFNKQKLQGSIISVKFTDYGKVLYDISVKANKDDDTELHDIDSDFVTKD